MTKVRIEKDGERWFVSAQGHATGSVQVCAAASALLSTLDAYVKYAEAELGAKVYRREIESGRVLLEFSGGAEVQGAAEAVELGLLLLQGSYAEYISVEVKEERRRLAARGLTTERSGRIDGPEGRQTARAVGGVRYPSGQPGAELDMANGKKGSPHQSAPRTASPEGKP